MTALRADNFSVGTLPEILLRHSGVNPASHPFAGSVTELLELEVQTGGNLGIAPEDFSG